MNIDLFKTFIVVTRLQSIYKAGEEIYLTQPAVSKQIKALEQHYGIKLFERGNKRLILTEDGKHLLDYAYRIMGLYNESIESIHEKEKQVKGTLKIAANLTLGIYILPKLIKPFYNIYPDLRIEMFMDNTEHILNAVKHGEANFGFIGTNPRDPLIILHPIYQDKLRVVAGQELEINKKVVSWKELEALPFVQRERGSDIRETYEQWIKERDIKLTPRIELNNTEAIKSFVQSGMGFSILPWCTVEHEVRTGLLRVISVPHFDFLQNYYICHY
ncbi:MAG: LysR family transcriptional regulator, partial [Nitrospirota bacterium]